jgi:hypothetical protein
VVLAVVEQDRDATLLTEHLEQQTQVAVAVRQTLTTVKAVVLVVQALSFLGIQILAQFQLAQV